MSQNKKRRLLMSILCGGLMAEILMLCVMMHKPHLPKEKIVRVMGEHGMCSGEQVHTTSGADYILSAGHCKNLIDKDGMYTIITEDKRTLKRRFIAEDGASDLLLIEGMPGVEGIHIADKYPESKKVTTLTHGGNRDTYTTEGVIVQPERTVIPIGTVESEEDKTKCETAPKYSVIDTLLGNLCCLDVYETISTAKIVPGSSGGALLDDDMDLVGVASASAEDLGSFVTLSDIKKFLGSY